MGLEELSWYIDTTIAKRLLAIPGMANVGRGGGVSREIRIILDPVKLQAHGLTAAQVNAQLRQTKRQCRGGRAEIAGSERSVRVLGNAASARDLGEKNIQPAAAAPSSFPRSRPSATSMPSNATSR